MRRFGGRSQVNHELLAEGQLPLASGDVQRDRRVVGGMCSMLSQKRRAGLRHRQPWAPREVRALLRPVEMGRGVAAVAVGLVVRALRGPEAPVTSCTSRAGLPLQLPHLLLFEGVNVKANPFTDGTMPTPAFHPLNLGRAVYVAMLVIWGLLGILQQVRWTAKRELGGGMFELR